MTPLIISQSSDPWTTYPGMETSKGKGEDKGQGKGPPVIPEPAFSGLLIVWLALVLLAYRWYRITWRGPKCGCANGGCVHRSSSDSS